MSFVGPRPALFNQHDLIALRTQQGVHALVPGLTGWAQVNGRDELPIPEKVIYPIPIPAFPFATPRSGVQGMQSCCAAMGCRIDQAVEGRRSAVP